ncbi:MAG: VOC family protein, partial [Dehalococcoidia bacterium]
MDIRIRQIALVVRDVDQVVANLRAVFGLEVGYIEESMPESIGLQNRILPVGHQFIELVAPVRDGVTGARYLERRGGDGGYMVICQTADRAGRDAMIARLGIRTVGGRDTKVSSYIQLHPKDTGGSFLEIDYHDGADEPVPPWTHAAGDDWMKAVRTSVIDAIAGVEIQADDPEATAARWSEIMGLPLKRAADGRPWIETTWGGCICFVPCSDGRPEGLGGMDLHAVDRDAAKRAARARGLRVEGETIHLAGTRMKLV